MIDKKPILYCDMDMVLCDYEKQYIKYKKIFDKMLYPQAQPGFYSTMEILDNGVDHLKSLMIDFDVWILTAPSYMNISCYTEKALWVREHFGVEFVKKLILATDKSLLKGDYLIDDNYNTNNQSDFDGILLLYGTELFPNWKNIIKYLKK